MTLREHPLRRQIVSEMHLRRWPPLTAPGVIVQMLRLVSAEDRRTERTALDDLPPGSECQRSDNLRHASGRFGESVHFVWEQHSEASTMTLFRLGADAITLETGADASLAAALEWAADMPGEVVRATRILVLPDEAAAEQMRPQLGFTASDLVTCHIGAAGDRGGARLWSDFRIGPDGFGRLLLAANGMTDGDLSRLVQRLQELGNYRNLALLGLQWYAHDGTTSTALSRR